MHREICAATGALKNAMDFLFAEAIRELLLSASSAEHNELPFSTEGEPQGAAGCRWNLYAKL
jgi:hypothetical protein